MGSRPNIEANVLYLNRSESAAPLLLVQMANFTPNPLKNELLAVGLLAFVGFLAFICFVAYRLTYECDVTVSIGLATFDSVRRDEEVLSEIAAIGIRPSSDAGIIFEEFATRFSVIETTDERGHLRDIKSITKIGGGNLDELVFVLLTLFRWNGIDAERVEVYSGPDAAREQDRAKVIRQLVLVPALDRVFDPALPLASQYKGSGEVLLDGISRIHDDGMVFTTFRCPNSTVRSNRLRTGSR